MSQPSTSSVKTGKHKTFVNRMGEGNKEAILFVHGSGPGASAWSNWQFAMPALSERYDCIAPDLMGFAKSEHPNPPPQGVPAWMDIWVEQHIALLDELGIEKAHLVGNSLGGTVALNLVKHQPERFGSVALMGSASAPHTMRDELDQLWGFYDEPTPENMLRLINWFAYDPKAVLGDDLASIAAGRAEAALTPEVARSFAAMFPAPRQQHVDDLVLPVSFYESLEHPVLLVHGRDDVIVPLETSLYMLEHLPNVQLHVFGQCSHWTMVEYKNAFNELLEDFFAGTLSS